MRPPVRWGRTKRRWAPPDSEWLIHHYWISRKSTHQIAREVGATPPTVSRWMRLRSVLHRTPAQRTEELSPNWKGGHSRGKALSLGSTLPLECNACGTKKGPFCIHHRDGNRRNNAIENLQRLCRPCHRGTY